MELLSIGLAMLSRVTETIFLALQSQLVTLFPSKFLVSKKIIPNFFNCSSYIIFLSMLIIQFLVFTKQSSKASKCMWPKDKIWGLLRGIKRKLHQGTFLQGKCPLIGGMCELTWGQQFGDRGCSGQQFILNLLFRFGRVGWVFIVCNVSCCCFFFFPPPTRKVYVELALEK